MNDDIKKIAQEAARLWFANCHEAEEEKEDGIKKLASIIESACVEARSIGHDAGFKMGHSVNVKAQTNE